MTFTLPPPHPPKNVQQTFVLHAQNSATFVLRTQKSAPKSRPKKGGKKTCQKSTHMLIIRKKLLKVNS